MSWRPGLAQSSSCSAAADQFLTTLDSSVGATLDLGQTNTVGATSTLTAMGVRAG